MARTKAEKKDKVLRHDQIPEKKPKNYLSNANLLAEIEASRKAGRMTEQLGDMILKLCERYAKHPDYMKIYSYDDDMQAFGVYTLVKVWSRFNPDKSQNPFAYFTQIAKHAFYQYLNYEKKQRDIKDLYTQKVIDVIVNAAEDSMNFSMFNEDDSDYQEVYDYSPASKSGRSDDSSDKDVVDEALGVDPDANIDDDITIDEAALSASETSDEDDDARSQSS